MSDQPLVSIVTISYNQAKFLERAIVSVLDQDYSNVEYIVVDPGSTDGSRKIIEKYHDRISHVIFEQDDGPADGLNKGFAKANGQIFGFLNSDDVLLAGAISAAVAYLKNHPATNVVSGHGLIVDANDNVLRKAYSTGVSLNGYAYGTTILIQPSTFFRKIAFLTVKGFNLDNRSNWDGELFIDMALQGTTFGCVNRFWSGYRLHDESITSTKKLNDIMKLYQARMFRKIKGRDATVFDFIYSHLLRYIKHIRYPRHTFERLLKGPIYGRGKSL